jgi:hypothetical protein
LEEWNVTQIERDLDAGLWVPMYYGNRFKVCRLVGKLRTQEESQERFRTLPEAQAEADKRNGRAIVAGDYIRSVETGWHGKVEAVQTSGGETMLRCKGVNFWDGSIDEDDTQWFAPADVVKASPTRKASDPVNMANVL